MDEQSVEYIGHIDRVTEDGIVEGWCRDANRPGQRLNLTVLVDNEPAGTTTAMLFRRDLADAGIGDGRHAFRFAMPYSALGKKRKLTVVLRETETGAIISKPRLLVRPDVVTLDDRVAELEGAIKLLQSRLTELLDQSTRQNSANSAALFQTVGSFFMQLAADSETSTAQPGPLGAMLGTLAATYGTLVLPRPEAPVATLCLEADAPLAELHDCLRTLANNGICANADVVVLDPGTYEDVALLPALLRNARYIRAREELLAERNAIAAESGTELIVFLSAHARPERGWLEELHGVFAAGNVAAVGGKIARSDGILEHTGLVLRDAGHFVDFGAGELDGDPSCGYVRSVDALGAYAAAFRRASFIAAGGFDVSLLEVPAAMLDLCLRLAGREESVIYQPFARALWRDGATERSGWVVEDLSARPGFYDLLKQRWMDRLAAISMARRETQGRTGRALLLPSGNDDLATAKTLALQGYEVTYGQIFGSPGDEGFEIMARAGIRALSAPFFASLEAYLRQEGETLDLIHAPAAQDSRLDRFKALVPNAKIEAE